MIELRTLEEQIQAVLRQRKALLPRVQADKAHWDGLKQKNQELHEVLIEFQSHPSTPSELRDAIAEFFRADLLRRIEQSIDVLCPLESRLRRTTINIGVSGKARVGKSTLLQILSGLSDDQIPTGDNLPVTAVRSRIYFSPTEKPATLVLHTRVSFFKEVIKPFHDELIDRLPTLPSSFEEFHDFRYPSSEEAKAFSPGQQELLPKLRDIQLALPSFEHLLMGGESKIALSELRQYVAYPTTHDLQGKRVPGRPYLAVKEIRLECPFPEGGIQDLVLVDLPGLGELSPSVQAHHVEGLRNEVDLVLLIKRPSTGMGYWGREDSHCLELLDKAKGDIKLRGDFVAFVCNEGGLSETQIQGLLYEINHVVNQDEPDRFYKVLRWKERSSAHKDVLLPALNHLAERLKAMDQDILEAAEQELKSNRAIIREAIATLQESIRKSVPEIADAQGLVLQLTQNLQKDLAHAFKKIVDTAYREARAEKDDEQYIAKLESTYKSLVDWIEGGFGISTKEWIADAAKTLALNKASDKLLVDNLNQIRVFISNHYCEIDHYLEGKVQNLQNEFVRILRKQFGVLVPEGPANEVLKAFHRHLMEAEPACEELGQAVDHLLRLKIHYRAQLHPRVRAALDTLQMHYLDSEGRSHSNGLDVPLSEEGASELFTHLVGLAKQAAYRTKGDLVEEATFPALILHAAAEQFDDHFLRAKLSESELQRFCRLYRDEIWPERFKEISANNNRVLKMKRILVETMAVIEGIG